MPLREIVRKLVRAKISTNKVVFFPNRGNVIQNELVTLVTHDDVADCSLWGFSKIELTCLAILQSFSAIADEYLS